MNYLKITFTNNIYHNLNGFLLKIISKKQGRRFSRRPLTFWLGCNKMVDFLNLLVFMYATRN